VTPQRGYVFAPFWLRLPGLGCKPNKTFYGWNIFGKSPWLAFQNVCSQNSGLKTKILVNIYVPQKVTFAILVKGHNSATNWARELFKPSKDGKNLAVYNFKTILSFRFRVFFDDFIMGICLCIYCWRHRPLGADQTSWFRGSNFIGF